VFALVAIPGLVALAPIEPEEPEKPPAREAALTLNLDGSEGNDPYPFIVKGAAPGPTGSATLRDTTGEHTAKIEKASACKGERRTAFTNLPAGTKTEDWCLQLTDVAAGHELTGKITAVADAESPNNTLTLTVNRRHGWFWPLVVLLGGFLAGVVVALFKPWLRRPIRSSVLGTLVSTNKGKLADLEAFVRDRAAAGESTDTTIGKVDAVVTSGPAIAEDARKELAEGVKAVEDGSSLPIGHPLVAAAKQEAERTDHLVADFYDEEGKRVPHPAAELADALVEFPVYLKSLEGLRAEAADLDEGECQRKAAVAVEKAQVAFSRAAKRSDETDVAARLKEARGAVDAAIAEQLIGLDLTRRADSAGSGEDTPQPPLDHDAAELGGSKLARVRAWAFAATVLVLGVSLVFAGLSVMVTNYVPKLTFASFADYFALFTAALGSGAAGAIILWLGVWQPSEPAES
jgi:hypothetical protein